MIKPVSQGLSSALPIALATNCSALPVAGMVSKSLFQRGYYDYLLLRLPCYCYDHPLLRPLCHEYLNTCHEYLATMSLFQGFVRTNLLCICSTYMTPTYLPAKYPIWKSPTPEL